MKNYILTTKRLGLRNWNASDLKPFIEMGKDSEVMRYFPKQLSEEESEDFIDRMKQHYEQYGYCYFAVDILETSEFIGFAGLMNQSWESEFTPCVDIGWRLKRSSWGNGYATEASAACLNAGFTTFNLIKIYAFAVEGNMASENVMKKIGMSYEGKFEHPKLINDPRFHLCVVYKKSR